MYNVYSVRLSPGIFLPTESRETVEQRAFSYQSFLSFAYEEIPDAFGKW